MTSILLCAALLVSAVLPTVEQHVAAISASRLPDGSLQFFFWDVVQGEWAFVDHRFEDASMAVGFCDGHWRLAWQDGEGCYRIVSCDCWIETRETSDPREGEHQKAWFRRLCAAGLRPPPTVVEEPD